MTRLRLSGPRLARPLLLAAAAWLATCAASATSSALQPASPRAATSVPDAPLDSAVFAGPPAPAAQPELAEQTGSVAAAPAAQAAPAQAAPDAPRSWLSRGSSAPVVSDQPAESSRGTGFTLGAVLIVLALGACAVVMRFKRRKQLPLAPHESRLSVLSSTRVGPKAYAVTAHVNGRVLLLGVTDHNVSNLGWLDAHESDVEGALPLEREAEPAAEDELPDDYPGSALRASRPAPTFASTGDLRRFQEVLRGAVQSRPELPLRPHAHAPVSDAATQLAAQTSDVFGGSPARPAAAPAAPAPSPSPSPVSLRRKRRSRELAAVREPRPSEALAPREPRNATPSSETSEQGLEGQVAGLRTLRNGS